MISIQFDDKKPVVFDNKDITDSIEHLIDRLETKEQLNYLVLDVLPFYLCKVHSRDKISELRELIKVVFEDIKVKEVTKTTTDTPNPNNQVK